MSDTPIPGSAAFRAPPSDFSGGSRGNFSPNESSPLSATSGENGPSADSVFPSESENPKQEPHKKEASENKKNEKKNSKNSFTKTLTDIAKAPADYLENLFKAEKKADNAVTRALLQDP